MKRQLEKQRNRRKDVDRQIYKKGKYKQGRGASTEKDRKTDRQK